MQYKIVFILSAVIAITACNNVSPKKENTSKVVKEYNFLTPEKWTTETFPLPPAFAPTIQYKGMEDIRFAPGWANPASDEYWTYAFVWWIDGEQTINDTTLANHLQAYYTGLVAGNAKSNAVAKQKLIPAVAVIKKITTAAGDIETYKGDITMQDYMDLGLKQLVLHATIHKKQCAGHTALLFQLSPKEETHAVWNGLNKLNTEFNCGK